MRKCNDLNSYPADISHKAQSSKFLYFFLSLLQISTIVTYLIVKAAIKNLVTQLIEISLSNFQ